MASLCFINCSSSFLILSSSLRVPKVYQAIPLSLVDAEEDTHEVGNILSYRKSYHERTCLLLSSIFRKPHLLWELEAFPSWCQICVSWKLI